MPYPFDVELSENDLNFLIDVLSPEVGDRRHLRQILSEDEDFRNAFIQDERVVRRIVEDDTVFVRISPRLFFEILLRKAASDLKHESYTIERNGAMNIPVFDAGEVADLLSDDSILLYMADMLSSFTRVSSYSFSVRVKGNVWRKIRFNDMDIESLKSFSEVVDDEYQLALYKRIADICLFVLGFFPDYVDYNTRYPLSGEPRPAIAGIPRIALSEYEEEGRRYYKLAAEHETSREKHIDDLFWSLEENFNRARKPLTLIAERYLPRKTRELFGR